MNTLAIWLPTYKRPHKLADVIQNIKRETINSYTLYFGVEADDTETIQKLKDLSLIFEFRYVINKYASGYSNTIQTLYELSKEPIWFHANDDFLFLPRWDETPISMFERKDLMVIGVPQNAQDQSYAAICFGRRAYIKTQSGVVDMPNRVFYTYNHNYIDTEFTRTAQKRGVWASSSNPCIDHRHPGFTGEEKDETYKKNDATSEKDKQTFESRQHLWETL
jgi:hypothetical protein